MYFEIAKIIFQVNVVKITNTLNTSQHKNSNKYTLFVCGC